MENKEQHINEEQLFSYLNNKLDNDELHEFEKEMANSNLLNDAVEGLSMLQNKKSIDVYVNDLNKQLQQYTSLKKQRRLKNKLAVSDYIIYAVIIILILCVLGYFIIKKLQL